MNTEPEETTVGASDLSALLGVEAGMEPRIKIGDKVQCGVFVCNEWQPTAVGIVVDKTSDGSCCAVDVMSLHGGAPWVRWEATTHLRHADA